jgi:hypothetical protein
VEVLDAAYDTSEELVTRQLAVVETVGAVSHSSDEDRHRCDLVGACEGGHHAAEVALRQRCAGIDTELRADGEEGSLLDGIQLLRAGTQVEVQVEVD